MPPRAARAPVTPVTPAEPCAGRVRRRLRDEEPSGGRLPAKTAPVHPVGYVREAGAVRLGGDGFDAVVGGGGGAAGAGAPLPQSGPALGAGRGLSSPLLVAGGRALFGRGLRVPARGVHVA